jgi:iron(III) transport system permease protein
MAEAVTRTSPLPDTHVAFWQRLDSKWILIGVPIALVVWLSLVPLVFLLWQSFLTPQTASRPAVFTLENFQTAYFSAETFRLFFNSVQFAVGTAVFALCLGTALAWMNERTNTPFKRLFFALSLIPLVIPGILFTVSWIMLGSPKIGILNVWLQWLFNTDEVFINIYTMAGMIWVEGLHYSPMAFLLMTAAFRSMDPSLEESALMSGASILQIAWKITLKLAWPAAAGALLILLVRALESFEVPALLGLPVGIQVYTSAIYQAIHQYPSQIGLAAAYAITLLMITCVGIYLQSRLAYHGSRFSTVTGKGFRPRTVDLGRWRYFTASLFILYFVVIVLLPFLVLVWSSLQRFYSPPSWAALSRVTLDSYRAVLDYPQFWSTVRNSLFLSLLTTTTVMLIGAVVSWVIVRTKIPGLDAARLSRPRARAVDHDLLSLHRHRRLRHDLDHAHRLCDALYALRHALRFHLDDADSQGARGISGHERRLLGDDVPPRCAAAAQARPARRLDLRADRLDPRAVELDPALQPGHRGGVDHDLGAVAERAICRALRARRHADHSVVLPGHDRPAPGQEIRNI